jgi:hypothetical protein
MRADLTLRPEMPPRGLALATGEDLPHGHSLRARCLILEVKAGDVDLEKLIRASQLGRDGVLSQAMAAYIQWLACDLEKHRATHQASALEYQKQFAGVHGRTNAAAGELLATLQLWAAFALEQQHITSQEAHNLESRANLLGKVLFLTTF